MLAALPAHAQISATRNELLPRDPAAGTRIIRVHTVPGAPLGSRPPKIGPDLFTTGDTWLQNAAGAINSDDEMSIAQSGNNVLVGGGGQDFFSSNGASTWTEYQPASIFDRYVFHAANGTRPNTFYAVSVYDNGLLVQQATVAYGTITWPAASTTNSNDSVWIAPPAGDLLDYPQAVADNNETIWLAWQVCDASTHTCLGIFQWTTIGQSNGAFGTPTAAQWFGTNQPVERLLCDPVYNRVYAIGMNNAPSVTMPYQDVWLVRLDGGNQYFIYPNPYSGKGMIYYYQENDNSLIPGMRYATAEEKPSAAAYNGEIYVAWYQPAQRQTLGTPRYLLVTPVTDNGTGFSVAGYSWMFDGGASWNSPYRIDVSAAYASGNPSNSLAIVFYGSTVVSNDDADTTAAGTNRRVLTTTDDIANNQNSAWYDSRLSQSYPGWQWATPVPTYQQSLMGHPEWYRSYMDLSVAAAFTVWDEDGVSGDNSMSFFADVQP